MSWLNLEGKTVVVTGGASGIGAAVVDEFLNQGCNVVVSDLTEKESDNDKLLYVKCDVTNRSDVKEVVAKTVEKFGKYEFSDEVYDKIMDINVKGLFIFSQEVGRILVAKGSGVIVNMSSESGLEGSEGQSIYAASKNAVNSLTRSWAKELGKLGVRVVGVAPGILEATGLRTLAYEEALAYTRGVTVEQIRAGYTSTKTTPLGRDGKLSEVADLVAYIASDRASYVHGVTYNVAGGKTRG